MPYSLLIILINDWLVIYTAILNQMRSLFLSNEERRRKEEKRLLYCFSNLKQGD